jgi:hypothetical protein
MKATANRQLRAYVTVVSTGISALQSNTKLEATIAIKNFGQTPAYKFSVSAQIDFGLTFADVHPVKDANVVLGHLAPSASFTTQLFALFTLNAGQFYQLQGSAAAVFVHGIIRYVDAFGNPHFTRFRLMTTPRGELVSCGEGNDSDDDV